MKTQRKIISDLQVYPACINETNRRNIGASHVNIKEACNHDIVDGIELLTKNRDHSKET